jgi:dTDP-4-amino-4,6-dideoxygalactose transaminase
MTANLTDASLTLAELEKEIAEYIGTRYAVVCSSARSAIRFSLLALGIRQGDEVLVPDLVPQELPITVFCTGAIPRFCDVDRRTCAMSLERFQESLQPNTKALIFAQLYGLPADPSPIKEITEEREIALIEDASQALGASISGRRAGSIGTVGILNFNKFLNVPLGAAVTTNDEELVARIKSNREKYETRSLFASSCYHMMEDSGLWSNEIIKLVFWGDKYLYKLMHETLAKKYFQEIDGWMKVNSGVLELWGSNSLTATIINQLIAHCDGRYWHRRRLEKMEILLLKKEFLNLEEYLQDRIRSAKMYDEYLKQGPFEKIPIPANSISSYKKYPILFFEKTMLSKCIKELIRAGFKVDYLYKPLHMSPFFRAMNRNSDFKESFYLSQHLLPLPLTLNMNPEKIKKVASVVNHTS